MFNALNLIQAAKTYFFCPDCKTFHVYGTEEKVNPKLCFACKKVCDKKLKPLHKNGGHTQVCDECKKIILGEK